VQQLVIWTEEFGEGRLELSVEALVQTQGSLELNALKNLSRWLAVAEECRKRSLVEVSYDTLAVNGVDAPQPLRLVSRWCHATERLLVHKWLLASLQEQAELALKRAQTLPTFQT
jgi:hypothetical protein